MSRFKDKIAAFMRGRYGVDETHYILLCLCMIFLMINSVVRSVILYLIGAAIMIVMMFRFMSRNHEKRRRENRFFLGLWYSVRNWFVLQRDRFRDRKEYRYRKCRSCRAIIKLPNKKGKHSVVCPKCRNRFNVRIH